MTERDASHQGHKLGAMDTDAVFQSYAEIELPERLRDSLALFLRLERSVLRDYDPHICDLFDRLLNSVIHANEGDPGGMAAGDLFNGLLTNQLESIVYSVIFLALTCIIVMGGISGGIEKFTKYAMPALFVMLLVVIIRSVTLPGAGEGLRAPTSTSSTITASETTAAPARIQARRFTFMPVFLRF